MNNYANRMPEEKVSFWWKNRGKKYPFGGKKCSFGGKNIQKIHDTIDYIFTQRISKRFKGKIQALRLWLRACKAGGSGEFKDEFCNAHGGFSITNAGLDLSDSAICD